MIKFSAGAIVRHIKTGNRYRVIFDASRGQLKCPETGDCRRAYIFRLESDHTGPIHTQEAFSFEQEFEEVV